jgi:hypothetical protein
MSNLYLVDDEDTHGYLIERAPRDKSMIDHRLLSLVDRTIDDVRDLHSTRYRQWESCLQSLRARGFSLESKYNIPPSEVNETEELPAVFTEDKGVLHLQAVASLLHVSTFHAARLTMSAMRGIRTESERFYALIGTRIMYERVLEYYHRQKIARISIISECLRLEQEAQIEYPASVQILDKLDSLCTIDGRNRGLLYILLSIATAPDILITHGEIEPTRLLWCQDLASKSIVSRSSSDAEWKQAFQSILALQRSYTRKEREEALEALLILLYERLVGGVKRSDLFVMLHLFQSTSPFYTDFLKRNVQSSRLVALIYAECMCLWRASSSLDDSAWVDSHPLLQDLAEGEEQGVQEMKSILQFVQQSVFMQYIPSERMS